MEIKKLNIDLVGTEVSVQGWVKSNRDSGKIGFLHLFDGSFFSGIQIVYKDMPDISSLTTGSAVEIMGILVESRGKQEFEIQATKVVFANKTSEDYPIQKKATTLEFLREVAHVRGRSNTISAVMKIRSELSFAIHSFYNSLGFYNVHTPIITSNDCEGAGEAFLVTTDKGSSDFDNDFFKSKSLLTVSGQLHGEAYAQSYKNIYTFGPAFRSEHSHTSRHVAEFWMIEPEMAFAGMVDIMDNAEGMVKYSINHILEKCNDELSFLNDQYDENLKKRLADMVNSKFIRMTYEDMITELKKAVKSGIKFENSKIEFGMDFNSEHEKFICEKITKGPVFATNYPIGIKSFYMKESSDKRFVDSFDMLVPGIGELIGGSARENNFENISLKAKKAGINPETLMWYLELRKFGSAPSAGFGLGFERLVMYATGMSNIRDVIPFPRTPDSIEY